MSAIHLQLVDINTFYYNRMREFTERQTVMISRIQAQSLSTLKSYDVNVSQFIRQAIKEKLHRDWKEIKEAKTKLNLPF